jgi:DNA-binding MarR family transcriptional regulator
VKKLVENGYLNQERSPHDRRMTRVRVSGKGLELCTRIDELYQINASELEREVVTQDQLASTNQVLNAIERYWSNYISYSR